MTIKFYLPEKKVSPLRKKYLDLFYCVECNYTHYYCVLRCVKCNSIKINTIRKETYSKKYRKLIATQL